MSGSGLLECECSPHRARCSLSGLTDVSTRIITARWPDAMRKRDTALCEQFISNFSPVSLRLLVTVAFALAPVALAFTAPVALPGSPVTLAIAPITLAVANPVALTVPGALALAAPLAVAATVALPLALPGARRHPQALHATAELPKPLQHLGIQLDAVTVK